MKFIILCTQNRKALADYRMRIPFQKHPTSPRPGAGILPQATESRSRPGVHPPRRGRVGLGKPALHITFALHLRTSPFLQLGVVLGGVLFRMSPEGYLLGNLRDPKIKSKNHQKIIIVFVLIFGWIFNGFWLTFGAHFSCFFEFVALYCRAKFRMDFSLILDRLLDKHTLGEMHSTP